MIFIFGLTSASSVMLRLNDEYSIPASIFLGRSFPPNEINPYVITPIDQTLFDVVFIDGYASRSKSRLDFGNVKAG